MLLTLAFFSWDFRDKIGAQRVLNTCRLIIICIYFWGGLQKINLLFLLVSFPWVIEPISRFFPASYHTIIDLSGLFIPYFETALGIGLLVSKTRQYAVIGAIAMHLFILFSLGPLGHNWAPSIWPWNIVMILLVYLLFWHAKDSVMDIVWVRKFAFHKIVLLLFGIMPIFSFFNAWDTYVSFSMYAGNTNYAFIRLTDRSIQALPTTLKKQVKMIDTNGILDIPTWGYDNFFVLPYPETRVYRQIGKDVCLASKETHGITLIIQGKRTLFNADTPVSYTCSELLY